MCDEMRLALASGNPVKAVMTHFIHTLRYMIPLAMSSADVSYDIKRPH